MSFNDYIYWQTLQETGKTPEEIYEYNHPEVVRCKECMFSKVYQNDSSGVMGRFCEAFTQVRMVSDDDYCSYGEREGE